MAKPIPNPDYDKHMVLIRAACKEKALGMEPVATQIYSVAKRVYDETFKEFKGHIKPEELCNIVLKTLEEEEIN